MYCKYSYIRRRLHKCRARLHVLVLIIQFMKINKCCFSDKCRDKETDGQIAEKELQKGRQIAGPPPPQAVDALCSTDRPTREREKRLDKCPRYRFTGEKAQHLDIGDPCTDGKLPNTPA